MTWAAVVGFLLAVTPLAITPGASFTLATQRAIEGDNNAVKWTIAGTATGIYCHALLAAAGLSVLVMRSSEAFAVVKIVGGIYLVGLGVATIWKTRQVKQGSASKKLPWTGIHAYPQAVLANVLNPKAASIYLTLAPQFLTAGTVSVSSLLLLASVHIFVMATWLTIWTSALRQSWRLKNSDRFKNITNRIGGFVLVALGVKTTATA